MHTLASAPSFQADYRGPGFAHPFSETFSTSPSLTIIVPTRNESDNVGPLLQRLQPVAKKLNATVLFVDDSTDNTEDVIRQTAWSLDMQVDVLHRSLAEQVGGLGGAVLLGLNHASSSRVAVLDADLQHPPELLIDLMQAMDRTAADVVVATRYSENGSAEGLSPLRSAVSKTATRLAQAALPAALGSVSDPMSGYFLLNLDAVRADQLRPNGFKILVDILGRTPNLRVAEVPFGFAARHSGTSKGNFREVWRLFALLLDIRIEAARTRPRSYGRPSRPHFSDAVPAASQPEAS